MDENLKKLFSGIIEDNKHRILRICMVYSRSKEDQQDLCQEVALNIWKSLPSFRQEAKIDTWVYRICLNVCMQHSLKLNKTKRTRVEIEGIEISDDSADLQSNLENIEKSKRLHECISKLNDSEKTLILLFLEDLSHKTISEITGITENYVAVKVNRIKKKLNNCFNNKTNG
jgi:RNA polymerase sigma-70 factor (ECF subfamily)